MDCCAVFCLLLGGGILVRRRMRRKGGKVEIKEMLTLLRGRALHCICWRVCITEYKGKERAQKSQVLVDADKVFHEAQGSMRDMTCILTHLTGVWSDESKHWNARIELSFFRFYGSWNRIESS